MYFLRKIEEIFIFFVTAATMYNCEWILETTKNMIYVSTASVMPFSIDRLIELEKKLNNNSLNL